MPLCIACNVAFWVSPERSATTTTLILGPYHQPKYVGMPLKETYILLISDYDCDHYDIWSYLSTNGPVRHLGLKMSTSLVSHQIGFGHSYLICDSTDSYLSLSFVVRH